MNELQLIEVPAHADLAPFVGVLYYVHIAISSTVPERKCILLANPAVDLVINLGGPWSLERKGEETPVRPAATLHGPHPDSVRIRRQGAYCVLGARLKHGVAATFLNFPVKQITHRYLAAEAFWPSVQAELVDPVLSAPNLRAKMQAMERALIRFFSQARRVDPVLRKAIKLMAQHHGDIEVSELARQLNISRQTIKHKFDMGVGLSPKQFGKLRRFQNVLRMLSLQPGIRWTDLAQACGYYDQAHLIREFNSFTGFSPEKFLKILKKGEDLYFFETADLTHYHMADRFKALAGIA